MKKELPIEVVRFKQIREEQNLTQSEFAEKLEINNSTADIERGKTKIAGYVVKNLVREYQINPLWLFGESQQKLVDLSNKLVMPKVITVNNTEQDNILMVNQKASAGYPSNLQQESWYEQLPAFDLPIPEFRNATYRGFQIEGDSMLPNFQPGDWVLAKAVEHLKEAKSNKIYVFVLQDSVMIKHFQPHDDPNKMRLISSNSIYPPYEVHISQLQEMWEVKSKLTFSLGENSENSVLRKLEQSMEDLKQQLASFNRD